MTIILIILSLACIIFFLSYRKERNEHRITRKELQYQNELIRILTREVDDLNKERNGGNDLRREEV